MNYIERKKKFDILNFDKSHFLCSNDICTPMDCVEEMINAIPDEFWDRKYVNIIDPCSGNGNFVLYLLFKLKNQYNLTANEINDKRLINLSNHFGNLINISNIDYLLMNDDVGYDLIVANPPYAKIDSNGKRAAKNHNLSRLFLSHSINMLNDDGYLVYILPDNWMSLSDRNLIVDKLCKYQFIQINIHRCSKHFPKVGSSFTWFVLKKTPNQHSFLINNGYVKNTDDIVSINNNIKHIPLYYNNIVKSILEKTIYRECNKINIQTTSDLHKYTKKDLLSINEDDLFKYPIWHTQNQKIYASREHKYQYGYKVYISLTSYYSTFIDKDTGMTQSIAFVLCDSNEKSNEVKMVLDHPLYIFLNNIHRYGNFNNIRILQMFPYPDNVNDIFGSFDINKEEQDLILNFINKKGD